MALDSALKRRSAVCYGYGHTITADGEIALLDRGPILGLYPLDLVNINLDFVRLTVGITRLVECVVETTKRYRK